MGCCFGKDDAKLVDDLSDETKGLSRESSDLPARPETGAHRPRRGQRGAMLNMPSASFVCMACGLISPPDTWRFLPGPHAPQQSRHIDIEPSPACRHAQMVVNSCAAPRVRSASGGIGFGKLKEATADTGHQIEGARGTMRKLQKKQSCTSTKSDDIVPSSVLPDAFN